MRIVENDLATVDTATAHQIGDLLVVRLAGQKPTPCHIVTIERALTDVEPPAFVARLTTDPRARCMQVVTDYEAVAAFRIGTARDQVLVHHAGETLTVDVQQLTADGAAPAGLTTSDASSTTLPFDPVGEPVEAYGYSRAYDLAEAVKDAIAKLPVRGATIPDWLNTYSVVGVDVEIGGIAGFNHLRVTVRG